VLCVGPLDMNGLDFKTRLIRIGVRIPVVMMSGRTEEGAEDAPKYLTTAA
jgi:FixJ family two-component response regulator